MSKIIEKKEKKYLLAYFSITFILLGIITGIFLIGDLSLLEFGWLFLVGTLSPTIAAVVISTVTNGKKEVIKL